MWQIHNLMTKIWLGIGQLKLFLLLFLLSVFKFYIGYRINKIILAHMNIVFLKFGSGIQKIFPT